MPKLKPKNAKKVEQRNKQIIAEYYAKKDPDVKISSVIKDLSDKYGISTGTIVQVLHADRNKK